MSKQFIADIIQDETGVTNKVAHDTAGVLLTQIVRTLKKDGEFSIVGFGKFHVKKVKARVGYNPATGEKIKIKAHKAVRFKASRTLHRSV